MSDLNAFFAKKDRRKRRSKSSKISPTTETPTLTVLTPLNKSSKSNEDARPEECESSAVQDEVTKGQMENGEAPSDVGKKRDDGWIELEDTETAQVHTGGRTIVEMKRGEEQVEADTAEVEELTEKFSGWQSKPEENDGSGEQEKIQEKEEAAIVDEAKFPTLAETKDAPQLPASAGKFGPGAEVPRRRPTSTKFSGLSKLAEKLKQQNAGIGGTSGAEKTPAGEIRKQDGFATEEGRKEEGGNVSEQQDAVVVEAKQEVKAPEVKKSGLQRLMERKRQEEGLGTKPQQTSSLQSLLEGKRESASGGPKKFPGLKSMLKKRSEESK